MNKALKLGFIGGAEASAVGYAHFAACRMDGRWDLVAGCFSRSADENVSTGDEYGIPRERIYNDWKEMLNREKDSLDAVAVLLPTPSHFDAVSTGLRAGIPVICEKELAVNSSEAEILKQICEQTGGFLAVTYNYTGYPLVRELRHLIRNGTLGKILHFQAEMPQEGFIKKSDKGGRPAIQDWRLSDGEIPCVHLDLGSHLHHLVHYLTGEKPTEVAAQHSSYGFFPDVIDNVSCLCRYTNDINGQMWFGKSALGYRNGLNIRIFGSLGSAHWIQSSPEELYLAFNDGTRKILDRGCITEIAKQRRYNRFKAGHPSGYIEAFANLYSDIADALLSYRENGSCTSDEISGAEYSYEGLRFLTAVTVSAASKQWEKV